MTGFVLPGLAVGLGAVSIKPVRGVMVAGSDRILVPQATIEELHSDELDITEHPVEQGTVIADHAFMRPYEVIVRCAFSNSPNGGQGIISQGVGLAATLGGAAARTAIGAATTAQSLLTGNGASQVKDIYERFLALQRSRTLCDVFTGKRSYKDMLLKAIHAPTDKEWENALFLTLVWRQVIIVTTSAVTVPASAQKMPTKTAPLIDAGQKQAQAVSRAVNPELFGG